jgi:hypothetical protein
MPVADIAGLTKIGVKMPRMATTQRSWLAAGSGIRIPGGILGAVMANLMLALPAVTIATTSRTDLACTSIPTLVRSTNTGASHTCPDRPSRQLLPKSHEDV